MSNRKRSGQTRNCGNREFAEWHKLRRAAKGLSRVAVAKIVNIDSSYITLIERDGWVPRFPVLEPLCALLAESDRDRVAGCIIGGWVPEDRRNEVLHKLRLLDCA